MKVVKKGREQRGWSKELECTGAGNQGGGCGAILLVEQGDVYSTYSSCRDEVTNYHTFMCSQCGVETDIKDRLPFIPPDRSEKSRLEAKAVRDHYNK